MIETNNPGQGFFGTPAMKKGEPGDYRPDLRRIEGGLTP